MSFRGHVSYRDLEILELWEDGKTAKEIAEKYNLNERSIKGCINRAKTKFPARCRRCRILITPENKRRRYRRCIRCFRKLKSKLGNQYTMRKYYTDPVFRRKWLDKRLAIYYKKKEEKAKLNEQAVAKT